MFSSFALELNLGLRETSRTACSSLAENSTGIKYMDDCGLHMLIPCQTAAVYTALQRWSSVEEMLA